MGVTCNIRWKLNVHKVLFSLHFCVLISVHSVGHLVAGLEYLCDMLLPQHWHIRQSKSEFMLSPL
jgi:hypothetical protein